MVPFDFVVIGTPKSLQSKSAQKGGPWQTDVKGAAAPVWGTSQTVDTPLAVSITYLTERFVARGNQPDTDNIAKPILDALKGLVYDDDSIVTDVLCRRRTLNVPLVRFLNPPISFLNALSSSNEFVHVAVDNSPLKQVHLW